MGGKVGRTRAERDRVLVGKVIAAVEAGTIAVQEVVTRAVGDEDLRGWLRRAARRAGPPRTRSEGCDLDGAASRGGELGTAAALPPSGRDAMTIQCAVAEASRRFARDGVVAVGWGVLPRQAADPSDAADRGVEDTPASGVVLFVREAIREALPAQFAVRVGDRTITVPLDVQRVPRGSKHVAIRAGDLALARGPTSTGTLSAVFDTGYGPAAMISGHVGAEGEVFRARLGNGVEIDLGTVVQSRDDSLIDAARIDGVNPAMVGLLAMSPTEIRDIGGHEVPLAVTLHLAQGTGDVAASVAGVEMPADFDNGDGTESSMVGLIKLDRKATTHGDSGAPVLDDQRRLVGFVIGSAGDRTYVIPARKVMDAMA